MTITQNPFCNPVQFGLALDPDANSSEEVNVRGAACTLYAIEVSMVTAAATDVYVKLYDATSIVAGTTAPDFILLVKSATTRRIQFGTAGHSFINGLTVRCVQSGGTAGTVAPGSVVTLGIIAS